MRLLAIDLGDKRTGCALGDDETGLVAPLEVVEVDRQRAEPELLRRLAALVQSERPDVVVLGLPLNMDGTVGPRARLVQRFGAALAERLAGAAEVVYHDERLTSAEADRQLAGSGLTHKQKKRRRDAIAAAAILRDYLDAGPSASR